MADLRDPETPGGSVDTSYITTPSADSASPPTELGHTGRKKRKAWGQPIPEFKVVLPPRKRAKTSEEKEQRKNERVIRNRKAADKSRQRQKAAVAELEVKQTQMEAELAALRAQLDQYQSTFGSLPESDTGQAVFVRTTADADTSEISQIIQDYSAPNFDFPSTSPLTADRGPSSFAATPAPTLSTDSPSIGTASRSPVLAPTLFSSHQDSSTVFDEVLHSQFMKLPHFTEDSGMTQYPAAILCDPLCQPETSMKASRSTKPIQQFNLWLYLMSMINLLTIYETFSITMLSPMCRIFQILAESSPMTSLEPGLVDSHFPLIHSLITTPTSRTTRPVFRMKLLSRLLACSPSTARLLVAATDRALQRLVSDDTFSTDPESTRMWASLLTVKWAIKRLEKEHERYRLMVDVPEGVLEPLPGLAREMGLIRKMDGVDYAAVERSLWRWKSGRLDGNLAKTATPALSAC